MVGVAAIVAGALLWRTTPLSFGWFAYAPLTDATFAPGPPGTWLLAGALVVLGVALVAGWGGYLLGRRARR